MAKKIDIEAEAETKLQEIEDEWPPERCDLATYRDFLRALGSGISERVSQLNDENGD